jgi:hypothetical protein
MFFLDRICLNENEVYLDYNNWLIPKQSLDTEKEESKR